MHSGSLWSSVLCGDSTVGTTQISNRSCPQSHLFIVTSPHIVVGGIIQLVVICEGRILYIQLCLLHSSVTFIWAITEFRYSELYLHHAVISDNIQIDDWGDFTMMWLLLIHVYAV